MYTVLDLNLYLYLFIHFYHQVDCRISYRRRMQLLSPATQWVRDTLGLLLLYTTMMYALSYVVYAIAAAIDVRERQAATFSVPEIIDNRKLGG